MATTTTPAKALNVYQKLLKARTMFLNSDAKKTGKNMHLAFKYFELDDIVPIATNIFNEVGLISIPNFTADTATMEIVNTDNGEDKIVFSAPFNQIAPIVSNSGKQATNEMQALGSSITYMRRYLYMIALDICEPDNIEPVIGSSTPTIQAETTPAIVSPAPQVKPLTDGSGNATETQIKQLKKLLLELKEKDPKSEDMIAELALQTSGFTVISKADCETLVQNITDKLGG